MTALLLTLVFLIPLSLLLFIGILPQKAMNTSGLIKLSKFSSLLSILISIPATIWVFNNEMVESGFIGMYELGFSLRFDTLSTLMFSMVSIIAFVVLRFSYNYLDGDTNQNSFIRILSATIVFVQLLILSGNLLLSFIVWVATSLTLHKLLIFYPHRRKAQIAAKKKFLVARLGDITLLGAIALLYTEFNSGNLEIIFNQVREFSIDQSSFNLESAAVLLVITAGLKSAQFPFHGWLLDVMEAPTPVSALLHAGLLNAGPFLMIRFAYVLEGVSIAPIVLFAMGAITALYGALVCTTQPTIKNALAYSSVAHMGFTLMLCGLGVYAASLLHLIAHSFYKAHSFLSSGSVIEKVRTKHATNFKRKGNVALMTAGVLVAVVLFIAIAYLFGINLNTEFQLLIIGGIILLGIIRLTVNAIDSFNYKITLLRIMAATVVVLVSFFALEEGIRHIVGVQIPEISELGNTLTYLSLSMFVLFFLTVMAQLVLREPKQSSLYQNWGIHLRNGLYVNVVIDRYINRQISQRTKK